MSRGDVDHTVDYDANEFGGLTEEEIIGRGRVHQVMHDNVVALMDTRVRSTGVLRKLEHWREDDSFDPILGGRPALISDRAILTGLLLLAKEGSPLFITSLSALFQYRLSDDSRKLLGLQKSSIAFVGHIGEQKRWYNNTFRAFHRMMDLMDPFPQERRHSKTYTQIQEILNAHDETLEQSRKARLDEFTQLFLVMTFKVQPRDIRRISKRADISFDQTYVGTPTTKGYSKKNLKKRVAEEALIDDTRLLAPGPVDAHAGWHVRSGERTDSRRGTPDLTAPTKGKETSYAWGWEANIAVRVDAESPGARRFPALALAATMSLPNVGVSEEAVSLMRAVKATGLIPGVADADKQYWANATVDRLHDPAFNEGFTPSTEYRADRLGIQGGKHGALFVEGGIYCPATPKDLLNASVLLAKKEIDTETYRLRLKQRSAYKLHQKEREDAKGRIVFRCPAIGPSPTVVCPIRQLIIERDRKIAEQSKATKATGTKTRILPEVDQEDLPLDPLDKICLQHSVSFATAEFRRQQQAFDYGTEEWDEFHTHARNSIESLNAQVKAGGTEDIETAGRRRVRGFAAAQIFVTILLTNFNLRKIAAFISDKIKADAKADAVGEPHVARQRRRDREWHNPYTDTYPEGVLRPGARRLKSESDGTGGPPLRT